MWTGSNAACPHAHRARRPAVIVNVSFHTKRRGAVPARGSSQLHERKIELLLVTPDKREGYHEHLAYRDYAISPGRFHWRSQNSAGPDTPVGRRYLESPGNGWSFQLLVRAAKGKPYRACGPVTVECTKGRKPMSIHWHLAVHLPNPLFREFSILRGESPRTRSNP